MSTKFFIYFLYSLFLIGGLYFILVFLVELAFLLFATRINGKVLTCRIAENKVIDKGEKQYSHFDLKLTYEYDFDNQKFKSSRLNFLNSILRDKKSSLEKIVNSSLQDNSIVKVYVFKTLPTYSIVFPLRYSLKEVFLYVIFAFLTPLMIYIISEFLYT